MSNGEVIFDYRNENHPHETWDQFLVRKLSEKRDPEKLADYLGGHLDKTHMDRGTFLYLKEKFNITSFVDVGCGTGGMVNYALVRRVKAIGIDSDHIVEK